MIRDAGRPPAERNTRYEILHGFSLDAADDPSHPLDMVDDPEAVFGSYKQLTEQARSARADAKRRLAQA